MSPRRYTGGTHSTGERGSRKAPVAAANRRGAAPGGVGAAGVCAQTGAAEAIGRAHSNGKLEAIREAAKQFQLGLQAGAQMAKGFIPKFRGEEEPASDDE